MRIISFTGKKIYGFLDLEVKFNKDLTFLTGINGSGKTTVVRGIAALTAPSLLSLAHMNYERIEVRISKENGKSKDLRIWATRNDETISLETSESKNELIIPLFVLELPETGSYRGREKEADYYREFETEHSSDPVIRAIKDSPSPMILGIERRYSEMVSDEMFPTTASIYRARRRGLVDQINPLSLGLLQAADVAESALRKVQIQQARITEDLKKKILLDAYLYEEVSDILKSSDPSKMLQGRDINATKINVQATFERLGLSREEIGARLDVFFNKILELTALLKEEKDLNKIINGKDPKKSGLVVGLIINYPQFARILRLLSFADEYIDQSKKANEPIDRYLEIVNSFLRDSGKTISFDETGSLVVQQRNGVNTPITSLSSGESQILVIITHLALNPTAQAANVFIVDEPELSLHVKWQEIFVDAVQKANPKLQIIFATHSPSIILDRTDKCIDLSEK